MAAGPVVVVKTYSSIAQSYFPEDAIEGMVTGESLNSLAEEKLVQQYPALHFGNAMVIEKGGTPVSSQLSWGFVSLGVVLWLPMVLIVVLSYLKDRRSQQAA